jgi:hypothetical protein
MRLRSCCVLSSFLVFTACFATEERADRIEDRKEEDRSDFHKVEAVFPDTYVGEYGDSSEAAAAAAAEEDGLPSCPADQGRMEDGSCAPSDDFFQEQEALDTKALTAMQYAPDPQQQVQAQKELIQHQADQMVQAEKGLDEIIREVKKRKKLDKGEKDPLGDL